MRRYSTEIYFGDPREGWKMQPIADSNSVLGVVSELSWLKVCDGGNQVFEFGCRAAKEKSNVTR